MAKMMSAEEIVDKALIKNLAKGHFSGDDDNDLWSGRWYWI